MKRTTNALVWSFAVALIAISPFAAVAAPKPDAQARPKGPAARQVDVIAKASANEHVKLDDEQKTKVHAVIEDAMAQAVAMQQDMKGDKGAEKSKEDRQAARTKVTELVTNTVGKVEVILTDEQKVAFRSALKEERIKAREEQGAGKGGKGAGKGDQPGL